MQCPRCGSIGPTFEALNGEILCWHCWDPEKDIVIMAADDYWKEEDNG